MLPDQPMKEYLQATVDVFPRFENCAEQNIFRFFSNEPRPRLVLKWMSASGKQHFFVVFKSPHDASAALKSKSNSWEITPLDESKTKKFLRILSGTSLGPLPNSGRSAIESQGRSAPSSTIELTGLSSSLSTPLNNGVSVSNVNVPTSPRRRVSTAGQLPQSSASTQVLINPISATSSNLKTNTGQTSELKAAIPSSLPPRPSSTLESTALWNGPNRQLAPTDHDTPYRRSRCHTQAVPMAQSSDKTAPSDSAHPERNAVAALVSTWLPEYKQVLETVAIYKNEEIARLSSLLEEQHKRPQVSEASTMTDDPLKSSTLQGPESWPPDCKLVIRRMFQRHKESQDEIERLRSLLQEAETRAETGATSPMAVKMPSIGAKLASASSMHASHASPSVIADASVLQNKLDAEIALRETAERDRDNALAAAHSLTVTLPVMADAYRGLQEMVAAARRRREEANRT